jgi:hypothetical protein
VARRGWGDEAAAVVDDERLYPSSTRFARIGVS